MRILFSLVFAGLLGLIVVLGCEQSPTPVNANESATKAAPSAVVIDLDAIAKAVGEDQAMISQLQQIGQSINQQVGQFGRQLEADLSAKQEAFGEEMTDEQQQELAGQAADSRRRFVEAQQRAQARMNQARMELVNRFRARVGKVAAEIAAKRGASQVLTAGPAVLWYNPDTDITAAVIEIMRKQQSEANSGAAQAPAPTPAPATPAAPSN